MLKYPVPDFSKRTYSKRLSLNSSTNTASTSTVTVTPSTSNKRKADGKLDGERHVKMPKYCDMYGMREKDALNKKFFSTGRAASTTTSVNGDEASSTTSHQMTAHDLTYTDFDNECSPIEMNLRRLCALCKLTHPELKPTKTADTTKVAEKGVYEEEYKVGKVIKLEYDDKLKRPSFEVKWEGYEDTTWEPIKNIWDCSAFQEFTDQFIRSRRSDMDQLWNELIQTVATESLEPTNLSNADAFEQIKKFNYNNFLAHFFMMIRMRRAKLTQTDRSYRTVYDILINDMKHLRLYYRRLEQLQNMHEFQQRINIVDKSKNLHVENWNDFELPPMDDFTYTNDVIPRDGIIIPDDPPVGCTCNEEADGECSMKSNCCPRQFDAQFPYFKRGLIRVPQGTPIFECNKACKCSDDCPNRVVQKGRKQTLCIFKTEQRGWGVRTQRPIAKGQYICEYVGEIISHEETERRGKEYDAVGRTYLFDLDFNEKDNPYTVDAAKYGNVSRFINHSCDPNLGVWAVWTNCLDLNLPKLCLFALRSIKENEELTFDYINSTNSGREQADDDTESSASTEIEIIENEPAAKETNADPVKVSSTPIIQAETKEIEDELVIISESNDEINTEEKTTDDAAAMQSNETAASDTAKGSNAHKDTKKEGFTCQCGAANCRKIIFI